MKYNWNNLERRFLSQEEEDYIRNGLLNPNPLSPESCKAFAWKHKIEWKVYGNEGNEEEIKQCNRIEEIELFMDIMTDSLPKDLFNFIEFAEIYSERQKEVSLKLMVEKNWFEMEDAYDKRETERVMEEEFDQDIEEPFIKNLINEYVNDNKEKEKYFRLEAILKCADFKYIDDKTIFSIAYIILEELEKAKKNNTRLPLGIGLIDRKNLIYLVMKVLKQIPVVEHEENYIYANNCPADAIREYIEKLINSQKKYISEGKEVPEDLLIPKEIVLSPKNIEFLLNSKLVDYIGAGENENEVQFYWKKTDELPALELKAEKREDGKFVLSYIKEEATNDKQEFVWDKKTQEGKNGTIVVCKTQDALEDIYDMDR